MKSFKSRIIFLPFSLNVGHLTAKSSEAATMLLLQAAVAVGHCWLQVAAVVGCQLLLQVAGCTMGCSQASALANSCIHASRPEFLPFSIPKLF